MSKRGFYYFAEFVLYYTVLVIMWGAFVRATGSGAGCGEHWPTCQGTVIPTDPSLKTWIEFSHRLTSGLALIFSVILAVFAAKVFEKGSWVRSSSLISLGFMIGEALVGAMLVLLRLVENDTSAMRAVVIALHLVNTFLLLFWLSETTLRAENEGRRNRSELSDELRVVMGRYQLKFRPWMIFYMLVGASGAIVALGDTLFPATSIVHGIQQDLDPASHFLIKLRVIHPIIACAGTVMIWLLIRKVLRAEALPAMIGARATRVGVLLALQIGLGFLNWMLLAPVWLQLVHLLVADLIWISMVRFNFALKNA